MLDITFMVWQKLFWYNSSEVFWREDSSQDLVIINHTRLIRKIFWLCILHPPSIFCYTLRSALLRVRCRCLCGTVLFGALITVMPQNADLLWPPRSHLHYTVLTHVNLLGKDNKNIMFCRLPWCNFKNVDNKLHHREMIMMLSFTFEQFKSAWTHNQRSAALPSLASRWQPRACRSAWLRIVLTFLYFKT